MSTRALLIDSDEVERTRLKRELMEAGFDVVEALDAIEGLFQTMERNPDVILLAEELPPLVATDLLGILRRLTNAPIIVIGSGGEPQEISTLGHGADFYQRRPLSSKMLLARIRALLRPYKSSCVGAEEPAVTTGAAGRVIEMRKMLDCEYGEQQEALSLAG